MFQRGEINATILYPQETDKEIKINFSDLNANHEDWDFMEYSVGDKLDLDNDGEDELIIDGPYGGMYLDVIDGRLYVFAQATGTAGMLDYTYYKDAYWIVYKDTTHSGRLYYSLNKYEGGDNLTENMTLLGEKNSEEDPGKYTLNGKNISEEELKKICEEINAGNREQ